MFYLLIGLTAAATVVSFALGWKDVRKKRSSADKAQSSNKSNKVMGDD